jgi:hypothetical protein
MLEVTAFQPDSRIEVAGDLGPFRARLAYQLSPNTAGTTLTNSVELDPPGALGLIGGLFTGRIQASVVENLGVLRTLLETPA